jgi:hypothetical protein
VGCASVWLVLYVGVVNIIRIIRVILAMEAADSVVLFFLFLCRQGVSVDVCHRLIVQW